MSSRATLLSRSGGGGTPTSATDRTRTTVSGASVRRQLRSSAHRLAVVTDPVRPAPPTLAIDGARSLRVPVPATEFCINGPSWLDCRSIGGLELRYWLLGRIHTQRSVIHTVKALVRQLHHAGFVLRGRPSKTVSDALATETAKGRILRVAWGRYQAGTPIPKTTWWRIRTRTSSLRRRVECQRLRIGERYFEQWHATASLPDGRIARFLGITAGRRAHLRVRFSPRTLGDTTASPCGQAKVANERNFPGDTAATPSPEPVPAPFPSRWGWRQTPQTSPEPSAKPDPPQPDPPTQPDPPASRKIKMYRLVDLVPEGGKPESGQPDPGWF